MISAEAKGLTDIIYRAYGSHTGYLFGILPNNRSAVEAIVQTTIELYEDKELMKTLEVKE